ncbi:lysozyme M1-like [Macrosteles quadrilineatus]|uniref:lysozyme M1-like n=1 Tax=Macrosteles quadrilineatus TaxID=74068 RepID=UPI0023E14E6A|nr:lysozyme M1-like [Macrosteles quadrilineatus]
MWLVHIVFSSLIAWVSGNLIIDVSHYNGNIDWAKVKAAGVVGAIAKVSEGNLWGWRDRQFVRNWQQMKANNVEQLGAYHYFRGDRTADSQESLINKCLARVDFDPNKHILAIDVEGTGNEKVSAAAMADTLKSLLDKLKTKYKNIYIYSAPNMENKVLWNKYSNDFSSYNLWIAHYTSAAEPTILSIWKKKGYKLWQYSQTGKLKGLSSLNFDLNRWKN